MGGAGLTYYGDDRPGISRQRRGRGFTYKAPDGTTIARGEERARLDDRRRRRRAAQHVAEGENDKERSQHG